MEHYLAGICVLTAAQETFPALIFITTNAQECIRKYSKLGSDMIIKTLSRNPPLAKQNDRFCLMKYFSSKF